MTNTTMTPTAMTATAATNKCSGDGGGDDADGDDDDEAKPKEQGGSRKVGPIMFPSKQKPNHTPRVATNTLRSFSELKSNTLNAQHGWPFPRQRLLLQRPGQQLGQQRHALV